jgi:hypothetical protein
MRSEFVRKSTIDIVFMTKHEDHVDVDVKYYGRPSTPGLHSRRSLEVEDAQAALLAAEEVALDHFLQDRPDPVVAGL